jgi:hypothetical protein
MLPHGALAELVRPLHRLLAGASSSPRHRLREGSDGGSVAGVEARGGYRTVGYRGRGGSRRRARFPRLDDGAARCVGAGARWSRGGRSVEPCTKIAVDTYVRVLRSSKD